jgi:hypothetical protein
MYKFNADLQVRHISTGDRIASYYCNDRETRDRVHGWCDGAVLLVTSDDKFVVASFDKNLFCTNASALPYEKAWDLFDEIRRDLRREADEREGAKRIAEEASSRQSGGNIVRESEVGVRTGDFLRGLLD